MKRLALFSLAPAALLLSGCATFGETFSNDLACSPGGSRAYFISSYGSIGISSEIRADTAKAVCPPAPAQK